MRITQSMIASNFLVNLRKNEERVLRLQNELSSGVRVQRPSDDPIAFNDILRLQETLDQNEKFLQNIGEARDWLNTTEAALASAGEILSRARELALRGGNDTLPIQSRQGIAVEVDQLREQLLQIANTRFDDRYLFAGQMTSQPAFDDAGTYLGDHNALKRTIAPGIELKINIIGDDVFTDALRELEQLSANLRDPAANLDANIAGLENAIDVNLSSRAEVGARINRLELSEKRMGDIQMSTEEMMSQLGDTDVTKAMTDLMMVWTQYTAALQVAGRMLPPTLVDFLR